MPFIEIHYLEGRTKEQREELAKAITEDVSRIFKVSKETIWIKFSEMEKDHFATGGVMTCTK